MTSELKFGLDMLGGNESREPMTGGKKRRSKKATVAPAKKSSKGRTNKKGSKKAKKSSKKGSKKAKKH